MKVKVIFNSMRNYLIILLLTYGQTAVFAEHDSDSFQDIVVINGDFEADTAGNETAVRVIDRKDIEDSGAQDLKELLLRVTALQIRDTVLGTGVVMQGLGEDYTLILVDNQEIGGRVGGVLDLRRIRLADVERIEIVRGASSARFGSRAMAGVINIVTRREFRQKAEITMRGSSESDYTLAGAASSPLFGATLQATAEFANIQGYDLNSDTPATSGSAAQQLNLSARFSRNTKRFDHDLRASYWQRLMDGVDLGAANAVLDRSNLTDVLTGQYAFGWRPKPEWSISTSASVMRFTDDYSLEQRGDDQLDRQEFTSELTFAGKSLVKYASDGHTFQGGAEVAVQQLQAARLIQTGTRRTGSVFSEYRYQNGPLTIVPGLRADFDSYFSSALSPKFGVMVELDERHILRATYGRGFRAPGFRELLLRFENPGVGYVVEGNPDLGVERGHSVNIGLEGQPSELLGWKANLFYNRISGMILPVPGEMPSAGENQVFLYQNIDAAQTRGVEFATTVKKGPVTTSVNYSFTQTRDLNTMAPLSGRPVHILAVTADVKLWRGAVINLNGRFEGINRFATTTPDGEMSFARTTWLTLVGVRLEQNLISENIKITLGVDNVFNTGDATYQPLRPRLVWLQLIGTLQK